MPTDLDRVSVVTGRPDASRTEAILAFLSQSAELNEEAAQRWLEETVAVALDGEEITGLAAVRPASISLISDRRFWVYRSVLAEDSDALWSRLFTEAFESLAGDLAETPGTPLGLCVLVDDPDQMERRPEAVWPDDELMFAGWLDDGRQLRLRYFWGAAIAPGLAESPPLDATAEGEYPLEERYRIEPLGETVTADDVLAFWAGEGAVPDPEEARRRVHEVRLVGVEQEQGLAGVSTLYLRRNPQLRMDLWHHRLFIGRAHRHSNLATQLFVRSRVLMDELFISGEDTRAQGMIIEVENPGLKLYFNKALWLPANFTFIGESEIGAHVRVHYFPGARVPLPASSPSG
jgi:hypothetical protein